jgi:two-component system, NarL family, sensor histidine kinase DevS
VESESRHRALVDAGIALTSELSLDGVLQTLVESAAALADARYAALGVVDASGKRLERFVTHGLTAGEVEAIGELPTGRGILGVLIRDPRALRLHDLGSDPRSVGFPANHPPMKTFLGVPIQLRNVAYGRLYLTEKAGGGDFTDDDEELVGLLAAQAAVAIENARLYGQSTAWSRQLESLNEIAVALAGEVELPRQLELLTNRLRVLLDARLVGVALARPDGTLRIEAATDETAVGLELAADTKSAAVLRRGRSERVDAVSEDPEVDQAIAGRLGARSELIVPLQVGARPLGVLVVVDREGADPQFGDADLRLVETFAPRAAVAVDLSQRVARDALQRAVSAQELERRRLARELHDETGQALTSMLLGLATVESASTPDEAHQAVQSLRALVIDTLQEVRRLATELRPAALDDFGLGPALKRLAQSAREHTGIDVQVETRLGSTRLPPEVETAVYRIVQEAVTNVVKHAGARHVSIVLADRDGVLVGVIEDDGRGFETGRSTGGLGLTGMQERVELLDGRLVVESTPDEGTTLLLELPLP